MKTLHSVQYLRACAALLVVFAHAFSHQIGTDNLLVVMAGRLGVILFFVISGFIMVYISGSGPFPALDFLKRRAIRIVPLYWLFTGLAALLAALAPSLFQTTVFTWPHFLQSLFFIVHEAPERGGASPLLSLGWTLNYEAYFYVAFAALAFLSVTSRIFALTAFFVAMWLAGLLLAPSDPVIKFNLNASPLAFGLGAWSGWAYLRNGAMFVTHRVWTLGAMAAAGAILAFTDDGTPLMREIGFAGQVAWGGGLLVLGLVLEARLGRWRLLEQLGNASYALYLSHMFVIGAVTNLAGRLVGHDHPATVFLVSFISIVASCIASLVIHAAFEKPVLRLLSNRNGQRSLTSSRPAAV